MRGYALCVGFSLHMFMCSEWEAVRQRLWEWSSVCGGPEEWPFWDIRKSYSLSFGPNEHLCFLLRVQLSLETDRFFSSKLFALMLNSSLFCFFFLTTGLLTKPANFENFPSTLEAAVLGGTFNLLVPQGPRVPSCWSGEVWNSIQGHIYRNCCSVNQIINWGVGCTDLFVTRNLPRNQQWEFTTVQGDCLSYGVAIHTRPLGHVLTLPGTSNTVDYVPDAHWTHQVPSRETLVWHYPWPLVAFSAASICKVASS